MSEAHKGNKPSPESVQKRIETCRKLGNLGGGMKGKHHTEEAKRKISLHSNVKTVSIICLENDKIYKSITEASKELNVATANIVKVCKGERKHTKGYTFRYIEESKDEV